MPPPQEGTHGPGTPPQMQVLPEVGERPAHLALVLAGVIDAALGDLTLDAARLGSRCRLRPRSAEDEAQRGSRRKPYRTRLDLRPVERNCICLSISEWSRLSRTKRHVPIKSG